MKKLFTHLCLMAVCVILTPTAAARPLSPQQALERSMSSGAPLKAIAQADLQPSLSYTMTEEGQNTLYAFNNPGGGWVILSANDVAAPVLAYSDTGTFDAQNIPDNMLAWMQFYSRQIVGADSDGYPAYQPQKSPLQGVAPIQPITKTLWNQSAPYNDQCPMLTSSTGTQARAVTGCVATAMAQVMKVHNYPAQGSGSNSYTFNASGHSYTESMDFSTVTFDWANMTNTYANNSTDAQKQAVATLMHSCGVSVDMSYGINESGAQGFNAGRALIENFGYDVATRYLSHEYIPSDEWEQTIYNELAAGRPVLYFGQGTEGGHAFVCDGYSSNGYYHFNWGWAGLSDGYYVLTALDPPALGIGGAGGGFNADQQIIVGIQPPQPGSQPSAMMVVQGTLMPQQQTYAIGQTITFTGLNGGAFIGSLSLSDITATLGFKLLDDAGNAQYINSEITDHTFTPMSGYGSISAFASEFPEGTFTITPAYEYNGQWYDVMLPLDYAYTLSATNTGGIITFNVQEATPSLNITSFNLETPIYEGDLCSFTIDISATEDYYGDVTPILLQDGSYVAKVESAPFSLSAGESTQFRWVTKFPTTVTPGTYTLNFIDDNENLLCQGYTVQVQAQPTGTPTVSVNNIFFGSDPATGRSVDPIPIDANDINILVTLQCQQGFWADYVTGMFFDTASLHSVGQTDPIFVGLDTGQSTEINLTGQISQLVEGQTYYFTPWAVNNNKQLSSVYYVQIKNSNTGVVDPLLTSDTQEAEIYNLQGVKIQHGTTPAPGIYIVRQGTITRKTVIR